MLANLRSEVQFGGAEAKGSKGMKRKNERFVPSWDTQCLTTHKKVMGVTGARVGCIHAWESIVWRCVSPTSKVEGEACGNEKGSSDFCA